MTETASPAGKAPSSRPAKIPLKGKQSPADPKNIIIETPIESAADFLAELNKLDYVRKKFWYRGTGDSNHKLIPSLFRHKTIKSQAAFKILELELNETFEMRSLPYTESRTWAKDEWEQLFFMQHFRIPTRLLDWSGSPLVSLHFAATSVETDKHGKATTDAAVWVLDPHAWNQAAYADTGFSGGVLSAKDSWLKRYSPSEVYTVNGSLPPVAIRGVHNSARIVAQQGYFTVFGPQAEALESTYLWKKDSKTVFPSECLRKFVIPKLKIESIRNEIFSLGISESTIYPDLEGLAAELKRNYGF